MSTGSEILSGLVGAIFTSREDRRERMRREIAAARERANADQDRENPKDKFDDEMRPRSC